MVRDAFVASVACTAPPVSFQTSHASTVPNASPSWGCSRSSHSSFVAEKYGSGHEACARADQVGVELAAAVGGAPVLPDDRRRDRRPRRAIPEQRRLALVGDSDRRQVGGPGPCSLDRSCRGTEDALPDLLGIVLDPAGTRKVLR